LLVFNKDLGDLYSRKQPDPNCTIVPVLAYKPASESSVDEGG
jgi:hypothetical protein